MTKKLPESVTILSVVFLVMLNFNCHPTKLSYTENGNWVNRADFRGIAVGEAVVFVVGDYAYVGTGVDPSHPNSRMNAMFQFDASGNGGWEQISDFAGVPRNAAVGFSVGNNGYVATGYDGSGALSDCWEYDPSENSWTRKADISDGIKNYPRYDAIGFGIGNRGYVSTGYTGNEWLADLWEYDPQNNRWTQRRGMGKKRASSVCLLHNNKAFVFTGFNNGKLLNDGWVFDPAQPDSLSWAELQHISNYTKESFDDNYTNLVRSNGVAFVVGGKGYLTTGNAGSINSSTWEYDFSRDVWQPKTPFYGSPREGAVGFTVNNRGFIATGFNGSTGYDDTWEFLPAEIQNLNE